MRAYVTAITDRLNFGGDGSMSVPEQVSSPDPHSRSNDYPGFGAQVVGCAKADERGVLPASTCAMHGGRSIGRRLMDSKTKEHALEYGLILGVGGLLLVLVFVNVHMHIFK
jgi:hypothetical protein